MPNDSKNKGSTCSQDSFDAEKFISNQGDQFMVDNSDNPYGTDKTKSKKSQRKSKKAQDVAHYSGQVEEAQSCCFCFFGGSKIRKKQSKKGNLQIQTNVQGSSDKNSVVNGEIKANIKQYAASMIEE